MIGESSELVSKLRATLGKMEVALSAITEAIAWTDESGKVQWSNVVFDQLVGKSRFEIIGANLIDLLPLTQDRQAIAKAIHPVSLALQRQSSQGVYEFAQTEPALSLEISWSWIQLKDQGNSAVLVIRDITQRQQAELELKRHQERLQELVAERTATLSALNEQLYREICDRKYTEAVLRESEAKERALAEAATIQTQQLAEALRELQQTQAQLIQSAKMSSLGQMVAGIAHEINNPVNFIYGNLSHSGQYSQNLLALIRLYQQTYPHPTADIEDLSAAIDLDFIASDLPKTLDSMKVGAERIRQIVLSLRNFSRLDEAEKKRVNIHEGIDSTLLLLQHRLKPRASSELPAITIIKEYADLPQVECYASQLNQVFMNVLSNAIDACDQQPKQTSASSSVPQPAPLILIRTEVLNSNHVVIRIRDNGPGIPEAIQAKLFDPFFTTKLSQEGTGLGLSISYRIVVEMHKGSIRCLSAPGKGTEFQITIPIHANESKT